MLCTYTLSFTCSLNSVAVCSSAALPIPCDATDPDIDCCAALQMANSAQAWDGMSHTQVIAKVAMEDERLLWPAHAPPAIKVPVQTHMSH